MKKKIFLACLAFCLYNAFLMGIHMVMILSEPTIWSPAVRTVFGHASRIQIVERNRNLLSFSYTSLSRIVDFIFILSSGLLSHNSK